MFYNREYLGAVNVKSGAIKVMDAKDDKVDAVALRMAMSIDGDPPGVGQSSGSLYVGTAFQEGKYSIFGSRNAQGELVSIEIHLDELES